MSLKPNVQNAGMLSFSILDQAPSAFILLDFDWRYVYVNPSGVQLIGRDAESLQGNIIWELYPDSIGSPFWRACQKAMNERIEICFEDFYAPLDSWFDVKCFPVDTGIGVHFFNISERKKAELALKISEQQLSAIYSNVTAVLFYIRVEPNENFRFVSVNQSFLDMTSLRRDQVIGQLVQDVIPPSDLPQVLEHYHQAVRTKQTVRWEEETICPSEKKYGSVAVTAVLDDAGVVSHLVGIVHDITGRKHVESELEDSKTLLEAIVENVPLMIFVKEATDLKFVTMNRAGEDLLGIDRKAIIGKNDMDLFPAEHGEFFISKDKQVLASGEMVNIPEEPIQTRKKGQRLLHTMKVSLKGPDGTPKYLLGISEDITEQKKVADDLRLAKEAAESASLAKSAFLANMSHEIRTPLGAVLGFADLITDPHVSEREKINFTAAIQRNGELLSNIINDILDLSKVEAGKMQIDAREAHLAEVLTDTKTLLDLQARDKGINLHVEIDKSVPEIIRTDTLRFRQILLNIIGNAIKFTSKGSVEVKLSYESSADGQNHLAVAVKDTGCGIDQREVGSLFSPFSQLDSSSKRKYGGTGLGLVLSKRIANLLGGDVVLAQTTLGRGSTFTITIDPGPTHAMRPAEIHKAHFTPSRGDDFVLNGTKVLLAEDSPDNQILVSQILRLAGATVDIASNGKEAVEKAETKDFDVILMDLQMPVMDGFEAVAELRKNGYRGKIIALTAHTLNEDRERCLRSGFNAHISKPIDRNDLLKTVATIRI